MTEIFVFGSNLAGRHGAGAALYARLHKGAIYGQGIGLQGESYAIPTKRTPYETLPLPVIERYVGEFLAFCRLHPELVFKLTPIGCGYAGYKHAEIAPMFANWPANVLMPEEFSAILLGR